MELKKITKRYGNKVVDVVSDVISAPSRIRSLRKRDNANYEYEMLRTDRQTKNVDMSNSDYRDPAFRARMEAIRIRSEKKKVQRYS